MDDNGGTTMKTLLAWRTFEETGFFAETREKLEKTEPKHSNEEMK